MDQQIQEDMKRLIQLYSRLKSIMAEAVIIAERHKKAERFCKIINHAVMMIDEGAHQLFKDAYELKEYGEQRDGTVGNVNKSSSSTIEESNQ